MNYSWSKCIKQSRVHDVYSVCTRTSDHFLRFTIINTTYYLHGHMDLHNKHTYTHTHTYVHCT